MKNSSISNSNSVILSPMEWGITVLLFVGICAVCYLGWFRWERFESGDDYRPLCWAEKMNNYWSHYRWARYASTRYKVAMIGDSVIWGQEVDNNQTITHYLNERYGENIFANMGIDGLNQAAMRGLIKYYGKYYTNIILQFTPYWLADVNRDLRGNIERFRHPRLVPQFHPRIRYNSYTLNERLSYKIEHYTCIFPLVRHILTTYFDNKSVAAWMIDHPYRNPFSALTFRAGEVTREKRGRGLNWEAANMKLQDFQYLSPEESVQFECFLETIEMLKKRKVHFFILLGPYNSSILTPVSRERLDVLVGKVKQTFDELEVPYFEAGPGFSSDQFADGAGHMLYSGHDSLAQRLFEDARFRTWLQNLKE